MCLYGCTRMRPTQILYPSISTSINVRACVCACACVRRGVWVCAHVHLLYNMRPGIVSRFRVPLWAGKCGCYVNVNDN